jgi:hypothetical protein
MPSFVYDFRYMQAGAEILEDFLLSQDVYWPIGIQAPNGETPYPQLSLGGLVLARTRAQVKAISPTEQAQLARVSEAINGAHLKWRVAWEKKASSECRGRLTQWRNYIEDYQEKPAADYDRYAYEVTRRVILQILAADAGELTSAERELIFVLDARLKNLIVRGEFIWDVDLQAAFPDDEFWFLYGRLPKEVINQAK